MASAPGVSRIREQFITAAENVLSRYCRQNEVAGVSADTIAVVAQRLWTVVSMHPLPRPLAIHEIGEPREMTASEVASLATPILENLPGCEVLKVPIGQLVKACFYPEFRKCRDSYRESDGDGVCRRQQIAKAKARVSGAHCVDCPYWTALTPEQHRDCLSGAWHGNRDEFAAAQSIFLPEDFRALRVAVRTEARLRA